MNCLKMFGLIFLLTVISFVSYYTLSSASLDTQKDVAKAHSNSSTTSSTDSNNSTTIINNINVNGDGNTVSVDNSVSD